MQHEVTDVQKLLDKQGYVVTPGWARRPVWQYNRENIAALLFALRNGIIILRAMNIMPLHLPCRIWDMRD
ncbi:MAG: hypothetical protein ACLR5Q_02855 [Coprococcus sp.]